MLVDNMLLRILTVAVLLFVGARVVIPLLSPLVMIPASLLIALPLDLLFPLKKAGETKDIQWCKNCVHYRTSARYEDVIRGSWTAEPMPRVTELPCDIADKALDVWKTYFLRDPKSRALYPMTALIFNGSISKGYESAARQTGDRRSLALASSPA
jgi:hypothetical protein